jgi:hypothetical protein
VLEANRPASRDVTPQYTVGTLEYFMCRLNFSGITARPKTHPVRSALNDHTLLLQSMLAQVDQTIIGQLLSRTLDSAASGVHGFPCTRSQSGWIRRTNSGPKWSTRPTVALLEMIGGGLQGHGCAVVGSGSGLDKKTFPPGPIVRYSTVGTSTWTVGCGKPVHRLLVVSGEYTVVL